MPEYMIHVNDNPENPSHIYIATALLKKRSDMRLYFGPVVINGKVKKQDIPKSAANVTSPELTRPTTLQGRDLIEQSRTEQALNKRVLDLEAENEALYVEIADLREKLDGVTGTTSVLTVPPDGAPADPSVNAPPPSDPDNLQAIIIDAIKAILANPGEDDITKTGQVKVRAIEDRIGRQITSDDRDKALDAMNQK
jgi:hypothetical protein